MEKHISIVIPNYNMEATIGKCLEAAFASEYKNFEVVVVDDHSDDRSLDIIKTFPCTLISLERRSGTSKARNTGAENSRGDVIFFIDADCLLEKDTLSIINRTVSEAGPDAVIGGTYSRIPFDRTFFSIFQAVFVNYSETKNVLNPDYIAAHAMIVDAGIFKKSGGFPEVFLPIIEDVEFTHRLKREGLRLMMNPDIQVRHIFNFSMWKSLKNAFRKTTYWNIYSLRNKDLFTDSGSASVELKTNVASWALSALFLGLFFLSDNVLFLYLLKVAFMCNVFINRRLLLEFFKTGGFSFGGRAFMYYTMLYPVPIGMGTITGLVKYLSNNTK